MCGRSACTLDPQTIKDHLHTQRWDKQPVVLNENGRVLKSMKWGYMGNNPQLSTINARSEGITSSPMWSKLVPTNRCAVVASGYFEWQTTAGEGSKKQPHFIHCKDSPVMVMAGLYEEQLEENESDTVYHYTIITTRNSKDLDWLHDRMPVILDTDEKIDLWLSNDYFNLKSQILSLLRPYEGLECYAVPELVNSNRNDTADCLRRLEDFKKTGGIAAFFQAPKKEIKSEEGRKSEVKDKKKEVAKKPSGIAAFFAPKKEEPGRNEEDKEVKEEKEVSVEKDDGSKQQEERLALKDEIKKEIMEEIKEEVREEVKKELENKDQEEVTEEKPEQEIETKVKEEESEDEEEKKPSKKAAKKTTEQAKPTMVTRKRKNDTGAEEENKKGKKGRSKK